MSVQVAVASGVRTTCPYCGVGCGLKVERPASAVDGDAGLASSGVTITGDRDHPANLGRLCSKGAALGETLGLDGRLLYPEIRGRRATWDEALDVVARGFKNTIAAHGPDSVAFYVSGQLLTEDYYVANKLMKGFIGSANIDTNSRLCMASAVAGYKRAFGADTVPNDYEDLEHADLIVLVGLEPRMVPSRAVPASRAGEGAQPAAARGRDRPAPHGDVRRRRSVPAAASRHRRAAVQRPAESPASRGRARLGVPRRAHRGLRCRDAHREGDGAVDSRPSRARAGSPKTTCSSSIAGSRARRAR